MLKKMGTKPASARSDRDFIKYMASIDSAQSGLVTIDSSTSDEEEVEIVKEMTVTTEDHRCDLCSGGEFLIDKLLKFGGLIDDKYKFVCDKCDKNFEHKSKLKEHSSKCEGPDSSNDGPQIPINNFPQSTNPVEIQNSEILRMHSLSVQNQNVSQDDEHNLKMCKICLKIFKRQSGLTIHMNTIHSGVTHTCNVCSATFSSFQTYRHHCSEHQKQCRNHVCTLCGKRFHSKANLRKHVKRHETSVQNTSTEAPSNEVTNGDA